MKLRTRYACCLIALTAASAAAALGCKQAPDESRPALTPPDPVQAMHAEQSAVQCSKNPGADICRQACELGHSNSCAKLGLLETQSSGPKDALPWFELACRGGSGLGCELEARQTLSPETFKRARIYHRIHCDQGLAASCKGLASLFEEGLGGPADSDLAEHYRRQASLLRPPG